MSGLDPNIPVMGIKNACCVMSYLSTWYGRRRLE